jgi:hypothetical protein
MYCAYAAGCCACFVQVMAQKSFKLQQLVVVLIVAMDVLSDDSCQAPFGP